MSDNPVEKYNRERVEKSEHADTIYRQTISLLQTEERFVNFFKNYNKESVAGFINYYAEQKAGWHANADTNYRYRLDKRNKWRHAATNMLKEIFLKKLFNLKCRWVAGEMDLPGIEISTDFEKYASDPSSCNFTEPITREEFNCYLKFVQDEAGQKNDEDDEERGNSWSAIEFYHEHRSLFVEGYEELIPPWFHYYDARFCTARLLHLPLIRKDLECDYHDIWSTEIYVKTFTPEQLKEWSYLSRLQRKELKENPEKEKTYCDEQNRKWEEKEKNSPQYISLSTYDGKMMDELVALLEPPQVMKFYKAEVEWQRRHTNHDEIESTLIYMQDAGENIPIASDDDYRNAIKNAYFDYACKMKMETLPVLFDEYCRCFRTGKTFDWETGSATTYSNEMGERIIAARKWKGEPENFDFLKKENLL